MYRRTTAPPGAIGLYDPANEHDGCGIALVAKLWGEASHAVVEKALDALENLEHRGAEGADPNTGDGAGILLQIPDGFLRAAVAGVELPSPGRYGVGVCYLPADPDRRVVIEQLIEETIEAEGQRVLWWRDVPVDDRHVGETARVSAPIIRQVLIGASDEIADQDAFERKLYVIRRVIELAAGRDLALPSFSSRTMIYKGMLTAPQLPRYFTDLRDPRVASRLALVHSRFSTNTFPSWELAHPFRMIAHNGEVNTLRGNVNWMRARESQLASELFGEDLDKVIPVVRDGGSDSAIFDNVLELLVLSGRSIAARGDDDGARGVSDSQGSRSRREGLLRLPLLPDGAMGRAGGGGVHRRAGRRRDARPQRAAPGPLDPGHRGLRGAGLRDRGDDRRPRARPAQGPPGPGQGVPGRPRGGQDRRGRGGQAPGGPPPALRRVVRALGRPHRRPARARPPHPPDRAASLQAAGLRLLAGGHADDHRARWPRRPRSRRPAWATTPRWP